MTTTTSTQPDMASTAVITGRSDTLAYVNLAVIALFALVVVIAIIAGVRLRARRKAAERETERRIELERSPCGAEPIEAAAPLAGSDELAAKPAFKAAPVAPAVDQAPLTGPRPVDGALPLTTLKGLGAKAAARLTELGVSDLAALAALTPDEAASVDAELGAFQGRLTRDRWVEQARLLTNGDVAEYEATFGKLGG